MGFKTFLFRMASSWFGLNIGIIVMFACIYYFIDKERKISYFTGISKQKNDRTFTDYLYFSVIVTSTLGLGEITAQKPDDVTGRFSQFGRGLIAGHVMLSLLLNDMLDSVENFILA
uniref:Potassium channel domain-containing protein n=1 Tax=viral metagenome TaxID=1070528 RepID=A0A6C0KD98_9ZZZZ